MFTKNPGEWLPPIYKNLLWRLELIVKDPPIAKLDADALWSESRGGGKIAEKQGNTSRRLHEALKDHCCFTEKQHPSGKIILEKKPFTDVIVCLHPDVYHDALIEPGQARLNAFLHNLAFNHQDDFKGSLPNDRKPRYLAQPDPQLKKNNVAFLFGPSIYIPNPNESASRLELTLDEQRLRLFDIEFWRDEKIHTLSIQFYAGQESLLLTPQQGENAISTFGWISVLGWQAESAEMSLLLRRIDHDQWSAYLGSKPYFPTETFEKTWAFNIPLNGRQTLNIVIDNTPPGPIRTGYLGESYYLALEAVCLPAYGNLSWTLWLDEKGGLASSGTIRGRQQLACLSLNQSGLSFTNEAGSTTSLGKRIEKPQTIALSLSAVSLLPAPEGLSRCMGLLLLPVPKDYPISEVFWTIGRSDPNSADSVPEICLNQLDQPDSIGPGFPPGTTLNNLGLSRRHAQFRVNGDRLEVKLANQYNLLYQLDKDRDVIDQRQRSAESLMLELDHSLVVGNFILRFKKKTE